MVMMVLGGYNLMTWQKRRMQQHQSLKYRGGIDLVHEEHNRDLSKRSVFVTLLIMWMTNFMWSRLGRIGSIGN